MKVRHWQIMGGAFPHYSIILVGIFWVRPVSQVPHPVYASDSDPLIGSLFISCIISVINDI